MAKGGGKGWITLLGGLALLGGISYAFYYVYKIYEQKKATDAGGDGTLPGQASVNVNEPYPAKPKNVRVQVPNRFV